MIIRLVSLWFAAWVMLAAAPQLQPPNVQGIGIDAKLNGALPLGTLFQDETGASVPLRSFFHGKPVLIAPVYYTCPMLCSQILNGVVAGLRPLTLQPGRDFEIVAVSFDPNDTPDIARQKRDHYARSYSSRAGTSGWHFLTGRPESISKLMNALGFRYRWDEAHKQFVHASGIMVATPTGQLARYLYGVDYEPKDLKLSLVEASHNRIGSTVDQVLLLCYHYDPSTGKYGTTVLTVLRGAGILTILAFIVGLSWLWRRDLRTYSEAAKVAKV